MLAIVLALFCDPPDRPSTVTDAERVRTYATVRATCFLAGGTHHVCEAAVAMAWRETRGNPRLRHTRGGFGLGLYGHDPRFWGRLVDGRRGDFCRPITATLALMREFQWAVARGATTIRDLQRVHAGRSPTNDTHPKGDRLWCSLLQHGPWDAQHTVTWRVSCHQTISARDVGVLAGG